MLEPGIVLESYSPYSSQQSSRRSSIYTDSRRGSNISELGSLTIDDSFQDKVIVITGSRQGIGRELVKALYTKGAKIYAVSRYPEHLKSLKERFPGITLISCNLKNWKDTEEALLESLEEVPDMLINNAEEIQRESFLTCRADSFTRAFDINVKSVVCVTQLIAKKMIDAGKPGSIVNMSSLASLHPSLGPDLIAYSASKAALDMVTRCMAIELGKHSIRVNSINPTIVANDFRREFWVGTEEGKEQTQVLAGLTPLGRFCDLADVINGIVFLLSDKSKMITGTTLLIDGGYSAR